MPSSVKAAIVGAFLVVSVAGVILLWSESRDPIQVGCMGVEDENPLGNGIRMTPEEAERAFNPPLFRPQTDIASDATIAELWVREGRPGQVFIVYETDMIVNIRPWNRSIREMAEAFLAEGYSNGKLITIEGVAIFTEPPQRPCFGGNAVFNIGGAHIAVINDGDLPFATVRQVTESILQTAPAVIVADRAIDDASLRAGSASA